MSKLKDKVAIVTEASKGIGASIAKAKRAFGSVDVLVNNAGVYEFSPLEGVTEEHFHKQFGL